VEANDKDNGIIMPTIATYVDTPYYIWMDGKRRLGPEVAPLPSGPECLAIYGFSDKDRYDKFCANSQLALKPYPLTKFYLQNLADTPGSSLNLVVVDAPGPHEPCLQAGTMEAVLQGQKDRTPHVTAAYHLTLDQDVVAYQVTVNKNLKIGTGRRQQLRQ
jgi:hypothetical protein